MGPEPLTSERSLHALHQLLGEHTLVDAIVTKYNSWEELAGSAASEKAFNIGPWAAQLKLPPTPPPLPDFGLGVEVSSRYTRAYPQRLTDLYDAPVLLYRRGRLPDGPYVAIGGSFHPDRFGVDVTVSAAQAAVELKKPIVAALDGGCGEIAINEVLANKGKVVAVQVGDLNAPTQYTETIGQILKYGGCIISEWGAEEAWSESRLFAALRIVAALGSAVVLTELGTHPAGGAHLAKATVSTGRFLVVPEPPREEFIGASQTGLAVFGRARSFSPRVFGSHPRMSSRVSAGQPAADAVVSDQRQMVEAFKQAFASS